MSNAEATTASRLSQCRAGSIGGLEDIRALELEEGDDPGR